VALGVVMAAGGYPDEYQKGDVISGLPAIENSNSKVFHAGTQAENGQIVTAGGRVLCVCGLADTIQNAQQQAYQLVEQIHWHKVYYRTDIGFKAIC
jgi:phosphoribosylamine--glycine ligase